jgi:hypothetical protein
MNRLNRTIQLDIRNVVFDKTGISNFHYPIDHEIVAPALNKILEELTGINNRQKISDEEKSILRVGLKWYLMQFIQVFYACAFFDECKKSSITIAAPDHFKLLRTLLGTCDTPDIMFNKLQKGPMDGPFWSRRSKRGIRNLYWNKNKIKAAARIFTTGEAVTLGPNKLLFQHHRNEKICLNYTYKSEWFKPPFKSSGLDTSQLQKRLMLSIQNTFESCSIPLFDSMQGYLSRWIQQCCLFIGNSLTQLLKQKTPRELWVGSAGSLIWNRILSEATRLNGGSVIAHDHGGGNSHTDLIQNHFTEYMGCDTFFTYNQRAAKGIEKAINPIYLFGAPKPKIVSLENLPNIKTENYERMVNVQGKIKKIMYVPTAFHGETVRMRPVLPDITYYDWQIRLLTYLKHKNTEVLYKPHPEGRSSPPVNFSQFFGYPTIRAPFESLNEEVDAYLIDFIASTTNATIMRTEKPIIFVDPGNPIIRSEALELLKRRCYYIPTWMEHNRRMEVDWTAFDEILNKKEHCFSMDFAGYYANS